MQRTRPCIVGIAGGSGSGKSMLAEKLGEALKDCSVQIVSTDCYFKQPLPKMISPVSGKEYEDNNSPESVDYERLYRTVVHEINDCGHDAVIIEGLSVLYFSEIRDMLDLKLFVELDSDERLYRRIKRNLAWGVDMDRIATYFLESAKHMEGKHFLPTKVYADIILSGDRLDGVAIEMIAGYIRQKVCNHAPAGAYGVAPLH